MLEGWVENKAYSMENESLVKSFDEIEKEIEGI